MMRESPLEIAAGALVLAVAAGFVAFAVRTTGLPGAERAGMELTAAFRSAEGVSLGTEVRMAGVRIGSVTGLALDPETYRAETAMTIREGVPIPDDSAAVVASEGLLGGAFVEIVPGGSPTAFEDGGEFYDTQGAVSLLQLLIQYVGGGEG